MYSKLHGFTHFLTALALGFAGTLAAQTQAQTLVQPQVQAQTQIPAPASSPEFRTSPAAPATPAQSATLHGQIADPTGALIPGATIIITTPAGRTVSTAASSATGHYQVNGLAPGSYIVQAAFTGFAPFVSQPIQLAAGQLMRVDISMAIEVEQQSIVVTSESPTVNVEAGGNTSAIVIKGKDLDALSDDPDELSSELTALAGPSAGPNGGQIYIDGFTGGQLPPKSAIREIRINQNPFSSEFDKLGYGRIEILTKPGTEKLHGQFFAQGNDNVFNTGNPFTSNLPSYHSYQFNGTLNGSLSKTASFFISAEQRNNQNDSIYSLSEAPILDTATNTYSLGPLSGGIFSPQTRTNIAPRIDLQLGQKNTLTLRYQFYRNSQSGNIGTTGLLLPSQATASTSIEHTVQLSDSLIVNDHIVNETHFQYLRDSTSTSSASADPAVTVPGAFSGGGSPNQFSHDHTDRLELQNLTTMSVGAHAIKFGARLRDNRDANSTDANFNGSFSFPSAGAIVATENGFAKGETMAQIAANCSAELTQQGGCIPFKLDYTTGGKSATANLFDAALFVQDDWKANPFLTLSGGLRWEAQNHISDHSDWAPRVAFAYALDGHKDKKQAKTVLRGGFGLFYDRFSISDELPAERFSGAANGQQRFYIDNLACSNATSLSEMVQSPPACGGSPGKPTIVQIAPGFHSPYIEQFGASLERQLTKTTTLTATYLHSFGVHQLVTRDSNAYEPGTYQYGSTTLTGTRPNPSLGIVDEYYPEAVFKQNQLIVNINAKLTPKFGLLGFYNVTAANSDGGAGSDASNSYNLSQDYGRASFVARQMLFLMANYTGPWGIVFNPFLIAQAGKPFNIVTRNDLTGDNFLNNRPAFAEASLCTASSSRYVETSYGCFDTTPPNATPQSGYTPIPVNLGNGPAAVAMNLRLSRSFGIGPKLTSASRQDNAGGPPPGGPPPDGGRGGPGGGIAFGPPGGFSNSGRVRVSKDSAAGAASATRRYTLTFSAQALNLFNNADYGTPGGSVGSPNFNKSTSLAGGIFSTSAASRRIFFQAVFAF